MGHLGLAILAVLATGACASYLDIRTQEVDSSEHGTSPGPRGTTCDCGWANKGQTRIVNGRETLVNEFAFMVALINTARMAQFCGGTLITRHVALTAAHCTYNFAHDGSAPISILAGEHDLTSVTDTSATRMYAVNRIIAHEGYENITNKDDISLLVVYRGVEFNRFIGPACLSRQRLDLTNQYVKIIGWGDLRQDGPAPSRLQKVNVRGVDGQECSNVWGLNPTTLTRNVNPAGHLCTYSNNKASCQGDSGGPVVWINPQTNRFELVGAVSFGHKCGDRFPSVHTRITTYLNWIQNAISRHVPGSQMCYMR